ncbi:FecR family protein [Pedobacter metabolipauper]|uniref:FecR family protein n=1 Tax=Pedobacter metabolipauper TaxID=425513 RepID=A0A4R6ST95_9SPHI|nr:FecR family protein [Pedobacter metabolipauper]TDQ07123.1 FecR family protein [Pedobacter metabolipauper]
MNNPYKSYFQNLLKKYRLGNATFEEQNFLEKYYNLHDSEEDLINAENESDFNPVKDSIKKRIDLEILNVAERESARRTKKLWSRYAAAAALFFVVSATIYLLTQPGSINTYLASGSDDLAPGGNKAILTLANGKKIILDDVIKGEIAQESGISIRKTADGQIIYTVSDDHTLDASLPIPTNTITTPNGGKYQIILPDGTKTMLNAGSSLTFPTAFIGTERLVYLNGEAYFEVTKNKEMPFRVNAAMQSIEVLGTHFNINAYGDEPAIKTTLLEGSVKVSSGQNSAILVPGQQSLIKWDDSRNIVKQFADLEKETAWKDNLFSFDNDDLRAVMRQISRWYDAEVVYVGDFPDEKFFGEISRNSNLSEVAKIFELNNIHLNISGKTIKVSYNQTLNTKTSQLNL